MPPCFGRAGRMQLEGCTDFMPCAVFRENSIPTEEHGVRSVRSAEIAVAGNEAEHAAEICLVHGGAPTPYVVWCILRLTERSGS